VIAHAFHHRAKTKAVGPLLGIWARRAKQLPALLRLEANKLKLHLQGAKVAGSAVCSPIKLHGSRLSLGEFCSVGRIYVQAFDNVTIGNCVVVNDGVTLISGSHDPDSADYRLVTKPIKIGDYAWIAMNATVLQGVTIGYGAIVGAGSVVTKDVEDYEIVAGNPARKIRERAKIPYAYKPSYWFGPVAAWVGLQAGQGAKPSNPEQ
jgi:acetyltransferase-like isoleucine patch superfamily enzyme